MSLFELVNNVSASWSLDDVGDNVGSNNLTNNGLVNFVPGKFGNAASFNGLNQSFTHIDADELGAFNPLGNSDVSFSVRSWVKFNTLSVYQPITMKGFADTAYVSYLLWYNYAMGKIEFFVRQAQTGQGYSVTADSIGPLSVDTWYRICGWYDSNNHLLGVTVNNTKDTIQVNLSPFGLMDNNHPFAIGSRLNNGGTGSPPADIYFNGLIDDVVIIQGTVMTDAEHMSDWKNGDGIAFVDWTNGTTETTDGIAFADSIGNWVGKSLNDTLGIVVGESMAIGIGNVLFPGESVGTAFAESFANAVANSLHNVNATALGDSTGTAVGHQGMTITLSFESLKTDTGGHVSATVANANTNQFFSFIDLSPTIGLPADMEIYVAGILFMVVTFPDDYLGSNFKYVHIDGQVFIGSFVQGSLDFNSENTIHTGTTEMVCNSSVTATGRIIVSGHVAMSSIVTMSIVADNNIIGGRGNIVVYIAPTPMILDGSVINSLNTSIIYTLSLDSGIVLSYVPDRSINAFSQLDNGTGKGRGYWIVAKENYTLNNVVPG